MRKFVINGMNIGYVAPNRSIDVSYDNTESGLSSTTVQDALDELGGGVNSLNENKVDKEEGKGLFSGSYNDLTNKPTIPVVPTNVSAFNNDSGYITGINKTMVTDALGYTPPTTNTTYSAGTGIGLSGTSFYLPIPRVAESCNALPGGASLRFREYTAGANYNLPTNAWYQILEIRSQDTNYGTQLALGMTTDAAYYRKYSGGSWGSWYSLINTNTTYSAGSNITLSGTTFSLTKANVTGALGYTPPTSDTNTVTSFTTKTVTFSVSLTAGGDAVYRPNIVNSGWTPLGVVGTYSGSTVIYFIRASLESSTTARLDMHNTHNAAASGTASVTILYYKNS